VVALLAAIVCGCAGGQSGTDQSDVDRRQSTTRDDAGVERAGDPDAAIPSPPAPLPTLDTPSAMLPETQPLCDGSERIRFSAGFPEGGGGPVEYFNSFGFGSFVVIDGTCRYWVNDSSVRGLRSGVLSTEEAATLSEALHYGQYAVLSAFDLPQCPDGSGPTLTDSTGQLACRCGACTDVEPAEYGESFAAALALRADLSARDEWAWGPSSILPVVDTEGNATLPWTLAVELSEVAYDTAEQPFSSDSGVRIDDPGELELLATLRLESIARNDTNRLFVSDANDVDYALWVRDEPAASVLDALSARVHE
jgi:hypothetical protein